MGRKVPEMGTDAFPFYIRTKREGELPKIRRLGLTLQQKEFRSLMFSWLKTVQEIHFDGKYPVAELTYIDEGLPVSIQAEMFSPFVPHDKKVSGTPGFYAVFKVKNILMVTVEVSLPEKLSS